MPSLKVFFRLALALLLCGSVAPFQPARAQQSASESARVAAPASAAPAERPNVVMIISDDQAWSDFSFMGHPAIETPHIDELARQSATFVNGYVPTSLCRPSLATIATGLYPHQHGITGNDPPEGTDRARMLRFIAHASSLPRVLREFGYESMQTGKWWEGHYGNGGFTHGMTINAEERGRHGDYGLRIGRQTMQPIYDFVEAHREEPFFLWYAPFLPHAPHTPPERLFEKYQQEGRSERVARYYATVEWFDQTVGQLLGYLDEQGLRENTLVLFAVDNGWIQRAKREEGERWYAPRSKRSPYDKGLRTPIMVRWPGHVEPGRREALASTTDLFPTILKAIGRPVPPELPGESLLALAEEETKHHEAVYGETFTHDVVDLSRPAASLKYRWMRRGDWKLIVPAEDGPVADTARAKLFNVAEDPGETTNRLADRPGIARRLREMLDAWWAPDRDPPGVHAGDYSWSTGASNDWEYNRRDDY